MPAGDAEGLVEDQIIAFLRDTPALFSAIESFIPDVNARKAIVQQAADLTGRWSALEPSLRRTILQRLVDQIDVRRETIEIAIRPSAIPDIVDPDFDPTRSHPGEDDQPTTVLSIPARLKRTGMETRLLIEGAGGGPRREPDRSLLRLLAMAHRFHAMVMQQQGRTMTELAAEAGVSPSYFTRVLKLSFLAPEIVKAILHGHHPPELTAKHLMSHCGLATVWANQTAQLDLT